MHHRIVCASTIVGLLVAAPAYAANVGYYDMSAGQGQAYQVAPITTAGHMPVQIFNLSAAELAGIDVLFVTNPDNGGFGAEYTANLANIANAVNNGMELVIFDRCVTNAQTILPGGGAITAVRDFSGGADADMTVLDNSTLVTNGPNGIITNTNLDGGTSSNHGYLLGPTIPPAGAKLILSRIETQPNQIAHSCYRHGLGSVQYSTNPADYYLTNGGPVAVRQVVNDIYVPNSIDYAAEGACGITNQPPVAVCQNVTVSADAQCVACASVDDGSYDPDGDPITLSQSPACDYPLGTTNVMLTATDPDGASSSCNATVTVVDTTPPTVTCGDAHDITPPDAPICFTATTTDNCGSTVAVTNYDCWKINGAGKRISKLNSCVVERRGNQICILDSGGVDDHIDWTVTATDGSGNTATTSCGIVVQHPVHP